jgi:uncharacterized protein Yka (UPF0111/DUF47 family)
VEGAYIAEVVSENVEKLKIENYEKILEIQDKLLKEMQNKNDELKKQLNDQMNGELIGTIFRGLSGLAQLIAPKQITKPKFGG